MATLDPARVFFALAILHPLAVVVLCSMVRRENPPERPSENFRNPVNPSAAS